MEITYYDRLNYAFEKFAQLNPPSSAQLLYLHILHIDNCLGRTGQIHCPDNVISVKTGLSANTVTAAKRTLKNLGLLDFQSDKKNPRAGTIYFLPQNITQKIGVKTGVITGVITGVKGEVNTGVIPKINTTPMPVREEEREKEVSTTTTTNAHANPKNRVTADLDRELEQRLDAAVKELDKDVRAAWIETKAESPYGGDLLDLIDLQKRYGAKTLAETITYCRRNRQPNQWGGNGEVNINYVQRVLAKGSEKRGNIVKFPASTGASVEPDIWDAKQSQLPF